MHFRRQKSSERAIVGICAMERSFLKMENGDGAVYAVKLPVPTV